MSRNKRGSSVRGSRDRASTIAKLISWFDSYVELYTIDPLRIQRALKGYEGTDLDQIWKNVKSDVQQIVDLPDRSPEVEKRVKRAAEARRLSLIVGGLTFVVLIFYLFFQNQLKGFTGANLIIIIPGVMLVLLYGFLMLTMISSRSLNKSMRSFYVSHSGELAKQKSHLREATQLLIERLSREIYSNDFEPKGFEFELYHSNYKNITVVGKNRDKFVSTVKIRAQGQK